MNQQDLVWVRLSYSNLKESKVRPAVVVSNDSYNKGSPDIVVCAGTSKLQEDTYGIPIENKDLIDGNLPIMSRVRADKIMQIDKSLVIRPFARLAHKSFDKVANKIMLLVKREKKS